MDYQRRKNMRLPDYDYSSAGGYFITVCTDGHRCILSEILDDCVRLTELGAVAEETLKSINGRGGIVVDSYIIMPNHIHLILNLLSVEQKMTIGEFVGAVKSVTANSWRKACTERGIVMGKVWQRGYYDHVLRCEEDYIEKRRYIEENPAKWRMGDQD